MSRRNLAETPGDLKRFVLDFLKASDFNIEDVTLHKQVQPITPALETVIQNAPIDKEAKSAMLRNGKIMNTELTFKHTAGARHTTCPRRSNRTGQSGSWDWR